MKNDGGPAFPINRNDFRQDGTMVATTWDTGMSLRDWFAGQALMGLLACPGTSSGLTPEGALTQFAERSYEFSDAMLEARKTND